MRANLEAEQVNWLVHQSLRQRLTPYRAPVVIRVYRTPGGRWLFHVFAVVTAAIMLYLVFGWGV
jgi:hypothetical protein